MKTADILRDLAEKKEWRKSGGVADFPQEGLNDWRCSISYRRWRQARLEKEWESASPLRIVKPGDPKMQLPMRSPPKRRITKRLHSELDKLTDMGVTIESAIVTKVCQMAMNGEMSAVNFVADRVEGKPTQAIELTGRDGGPIAHIGVELTPSDAARLYANTLSDPEAGLDFDYDGAEHRPSDGDGEVLDLEPGAYREEK